MILLERNAIGDQGIFFGHDEWLLFWTRRMAAEDSRLCFVTKDYEKELSSGTKQEQRRRSGLNLYIHLDQRMPRYSRRQDEERADDGELIIV
jgi:hypothetical protein